MGVAVVLSFRKYSERVWVDNFIRLARVYSRMGLKV